jgi:hypothetical protein
MTLQIANYLFKTTNADDIVINALCNAFKHNERVHALVGEYANFKRGVQILITHCYFMVKKLDGVFVAKNEATVLLYYQNSSHYYTFKDALRYVYLGLRIIGVQQLKTVILREKHVKQKRAVELKKHGETDYLYVWFLGQTAEEKSVEGLFAAKKHIFERAKALKLPIYMETSNQRLLPIYKRIGFEFYDTLEDASTKLTISFARCAPTSINHPNS